MRFVATTRRAGSSMVITIPKDCVYTVGLVNHQKVSVEIKPRFEVMCACGNLYSTEKCSDHDCTYMKLPEGREVEAISKFLKQKKEESN